MTTKVVVIGCNVLASWICLDLSALERHALQTFFARWMSAGLRLQMIAFRRCGMDRILARAAAASTV